MWRSKGGKVARVGQDSRNGRRASAVGQERSLRIRMRFPQGGHLRDAGVTGISPETRFDAAYKAVMGSRQLAGGSRGRPIDFTIARSTSSSRAVCRAAAMRTAMSWFMRHGRIRLDIVMR